MTKARRKFLEKACAVGYDSDDLPRLSPFFDAACDALALGWPVMAFVFRALILEARPVLSVADECHVTDRTLQRWLHGGKENKRFRLGAVDWFLVLTELHREAEELVKGGNAVLRDTYGGMFTVQPEVPIHRSFYAALFTAWIEARDEPDVQASLPWEGDELQPDRLQRATIPWPATARKICPETTGSLYSVLALFLAIASHSGESIAVCALFAGLTRGSYSLWRRFLEILAMNADLGRKESADAEARRLIADARAEPGMDLLFEGIFARAGIG